MTTPLTKLLLIAHHQGPILPLGLGYLAAYLKQQEIPVETVIELAPELTLEMVERHEPDIIGISTVTRDYNKSVAFAQAVKSRFNLPIIVGGHHISPIPHTLPGCFDAAVIGEGEVTLAELMKSFIKEGRLDPDRLKDINGIAFHSDTGYVAINKEREQIQNLDILPRPDRSLYDMDEAMVPTYDWSFVEPMNMTSMSSSRGCPYDCIYCSSAAFWKKYRMFSAQYVVDEIEEIVNVYQADAIMIVDDLFTASRKRLRQIAELMEERALAGKVKFWVNARANILDEEIAALLKRMNAFHVGLGFESFSPPVLARLKKDTVTVEQNHRAFNVAKAAGFDVEGCFIVGSPGETLMDMAKTYEFLRDSNIDSFGVQVMTPLPGTEIWRMAEQEGLVSETMDFDELFDFNPINYIENFDAYKKFIMTKEVSSSDFLKMYRKFQALQMIKGRYSKLQLKDMVSARFWQRIVQEPSLLWRSLKFALTGRVFKFPKLWNLYQRLKTVWK